MGFIDDNELSLIAENLLKSGYEITKSIIEEKPINVFRTKVLNEIKKLLSNKGNILEGPLLIEPKYLMMKEVLSSKRNESTFNSLIRDDIIFFQDNHSTSKIGVLRGLHYQIPINSSR